MILETVMTSIKEMKGFKVLRRLKLGELLYTTGRPEREHSGLTRIQGRMESGKPGSPAEQIEGWVTIYGNTSAMYLENIERPILAEKPASYPEEEENHHHDQEEEEEDVPMKKSEEESSEPAKLDQVQDKVEDVPMKEVQVE